MAKSRQKDISYKGKDTPYGLLLALASGPKQVTDLAMTKMFFGKLIGSENGVAQDTQVSRNLDMLVLKKLVKREKEIKTTSGRKRVFYSLTPKGKELVMDQQKKPYLSTKLKMEILSEPKKVPPSKFLQPYQYKRLEQIEKVLEIRMVCDKIAAENKKIPIEVKKMLARRLGVNIRFVERTNLREIIPWEKVSFETAAGIYLPALEKTNPKAAEYFKSILLKSEPYLKKRTTTIPNKIPPLTSINRVRNREINSKALLEHVSTPDSTHYSFRRTNSDGSTELVTEQIGSTNSALLPLRVEITKIFLGTPNGEIYFPELRKRLIEKGIKNYQITSRALAELVDLGALEKVGKKTYRITQFWDKNPALTKKLTQHNSA